jgi:uncharacterized membrane protein
MQSLKLMQRCYYVLVKLNCVRFTHIKTCIMIQEGRAENFTGQVFWVIFQISFVLFPCSFVLFLGFW